MAVWTAIERQTIAPGADAVFTFNPVPCTRGFVRNRLGSGNFLLKGQVLRKPCGCFPKTADYLVDFSGNIGISEGGTVSPISIAITLDGSVLQESQMVSTPSAAEEFNAVGKATDVGVWSGCCETITIRNTSNQPIDMENGILRITRPDLNVTR